jgi:hypothetical protein
MKSSSKTDPDTSVQIVAGGVVVLVSYILGKKVGKFKLKRQLKAFDK